MRKWGINNPEKFDYSKIDQDCVVVYHLDIFVNEPSKIKDLVDYCLETGKDLYIPVAKSDDPMTSFWSKRKDRWVCYSDILDKYECNLFETKNGITKPIISFFKKNKIQKSDSDFGDIEIIKPFDTWNAGVIGFNSKYTYLLKDIEEFTNLFYPKIKSHITEQLAFCYYFKKIKTPQVTDESIFHYWDFKLFRSILEEFFYYNKSKNLIELIAEIDKIDPKVLSKEKIDYRKKTFFEKIIHRILKGRKWKIAPYKL
jgi:hypothetical protein